MRIVTRRLRVNVLRETLNNSLLRLIMETSALTSLSIPAQITLYSGVAIVLCLSWRFVRHLRERRMMIPVSGTFSGAHHWQLIGIITHTAYCSICESLLIDGMHCDSCGICTDFSCRKRADSMEFQCKTLSLPKSDNPDEVYHQRHHWVRGNLPEHSVCDVCKEECDDTSALIDYRCCWCQRTVHENNCHAERKDDDCDFGEWRRCIVPPFCISHKQVWVKGRRKLVVESVKYFADEPKWTPLLVITNKKSGNNDGERILKAFRTILNPLQVIDLSETSLELGLEWCRLLSVSHKEINLRILVAGGDGTIGWTLNTIEKLKLDPKPYVGIIPLGTGNDLSRVLGWGQSFSSDFSMKHVLKKILKAKVVDLDRWRIKLSPGRSMALGLPLPSQDIYMNNYFGVGVDALVALNFHNTRDSVIYKWFFNNRFSNRFLYLLYGTKDGLERKCKNLNKKIKLEMDGHEIDLPELESIIVLNIQSWGGGAHIYNQGTGASDAPKQFFNDKLVEVLGLYSSFHIGQLLIGLSEPLRFGQAKVVKIKLMDRLPIQVDGEPWLQYPTTITITWNSHAKMLTTRADNGGKKNN